LGVGELTRALSARAKRAALAHETDDAFLILLTITDPDSNEVVRLVNNNEDVTSRGEVFSACAFIFTFPSDDDDAPKGVTIQIDNVDQRLIDMLRSIVVPISFLVEVVIAQTPSIVEMQLPDLKMVQVQWDSNVVEATLQSDDPLNQQYPSHIYEPRTFAGCF
jgi:hypothetical protein